jgi:hypothetical protein
MIVLALVCLQFQVNQATAQNSDYFTNYDITIYPGAPNLSNIVLVEPDNGSFRVTWSFSTNSADCVGGYCTTDIVNPFPYLNYTPSPLMLYGLTNGGSDVVLLTNTGFYGGGTDWDTLFPGTSEASFAADIGDASAGGPSFCSRVPCSHPGANEVAAFTSQFATYPSSLGVGAGGTFNLWEFPIASDGYGSLIGFGYTSATSVKVVPERGRSMPYFLLAAAACFGAALSKLRIRSSSSAKF